MPSTSGDFRAHDAPRLSTWQRVAAACGSAVLVMLLGVLTARGLARERELGRWADRTQAVIRTLDAALIRLVDAETGQRGYIVTGDSAFLEPYRDAGRDEGGIAAIARASDLGRGKALMDSARRVAHEMRTYADSQLAVRQARVARQERLLLLLVLGGTIAATLLAFLLNGLFTRYATAQSAAMVRLGSQADALAQQNVQLQEQALELEMQAAQQEEQAAELEMQADELRTSGEELVRQRQAAEDANGAKSQFLAAMSHELRTPLNAIHGYVELMQMNVYGPLTEAQREALDRILRNEQMLLALVTDVLNFAKLEAGRVELSLDDVPLGELLGELDPLIAVHVRAKKLTYAAHIAEGCDEAVAVRADRERVQQVLLNLLTNAVKFTPPGGTVSLTCAVEDGHVAFRVADTGRGIAGEKLATVFEPFVQVDRHLTHTSQQGVGLGLAISRDLARLMGGDITASSTPGAGSTFTLTLPLSAARAP